jgi:hypothetical protein
MTARDDDDDEGREEVIVQLVHELHAAITAFCQQEDHVTTGEVMGALFSVFVMSAMRSPTYEPDRLVSEVDHKIRQAVNMQ